MGAFYRFDLIGADGSTMPGHVEGEYTVETALSWALDDIRTGRARPRQIIAGGRVVYDQVAIERLAALPEPIEYE